MPSFDVTLFLNSGAAVNVRQTATSSNQLISDLERELGKDDQAKLTSRQEGIVLVLRRPKDVVVGIMVDQID